MNPWELTRGRTRAILGGLALVQLPLVLAVWAMMLIEARAPGEELFGLASAWPAPVAVAVGIGFGMLLSFVQAPLAVGVLGAVYCDQRAERAAGASQPATALIRRSLSPAPTLWHQPFEAQR